MDPHHDTSAHQDRMGQARCALRVGPHGILKGAHSRPTEVNPDCPCGAIHEPGAFICRMRPRLCQHRFHRTISGRCSPHTEGVGGGSHATARCHHGLHLERQRDVPVAERGGHRPATSRCNCRRMRSAGSRHQDVQSRYHVRSARVDAQAGDLREQPQLAGVHAFPEGIGQPINEYVLHPSDFQCLSVQVMNVTKKLIPCDTDTNILEHICEVMLDRSLRLHPGLLQPRFAAPGSVSALSVTEPAPHCHCRHRSHH
jgi:hypothetical protein